MWITGIAHNRRSHLVSEEISGIGNTPDNLRYKGYCWMALTIPHLSEWLGRQRDPFSCSNNSSMNLSPPPASADLAGIARSTAKTRRMQLSLPVLLLSLFQKTPR